MYILCTYGCGLYNINTDICIHNVLYYFLVLAEDAIKAALKDYQVKQKKSDDVATVAAGKS